MSTDLVSLDSRIAYAKTVAVSDLLPADYRGRPADVLVAIEYGAALGLAPIAALRGIAVIKGRPTLTSDTMAAVVRKAGHKLRVIEDTDAMSVTAILIRADDEDFEFRVTWDIAKAKQAGLWGQRGPWTQYPLQMMRARAISEVCRQGASDALAGLIYTPEDFDTVQVGEATITTPTATVASPAAPASAPSPARTASAASPAPAPQGDDERLAALQAECAALVTSWCDRFGGDPEEIAAEWQAIDGTANPRDLKKWLFAKAQAMKGQKK